MGLQGHGDQAADAQINPQLLGPAGGGIGVELPPGPLKPLGPKPVLI